MPMRIPKPAPAALKLFEQLTPGREGVIAKKVFGQPAVFVNGNMFFGVFGEKLFVRLAADDRAEAERIPGFTTFEPMPGRAMREYMVLPSGVLGDPHRSREWVARSLNYASRLPTKSSKRKVK
jgi:TfoX/Sxy family transcriptional regulator of competence genes